MDKIKIVAPNMRYISQDLGQLEFYDDKPPVSWPLSLIDIGEATFEEYLHNLQTVNVNVTIRIAHCTYSDVSNLPNTQVRELALTFYELEHAIGNALHNWTPPHDELGALTRISTSTEKRDDNIRVRVLTFNVSMQYDSEAISMRTIPLNVIGNTNP